MPTPAPYRAADIAKVAAGLGIVADHGIAGGHEVAALPRVIAAAPGRRARSARSARRTSPPLPRRSAPWKFTRRRTRSRRGAPRGPPLRSRAAHAVWHPRVAGRRSRMLFGELGHRKCFRPGRGVRRGESHGGPQGPLGAWQPFCASKLTRQHGRWLVSLKARGARQTGSKKPTSQERHRKRHHPRPRG